MDATINMERISKIAQVLFNRNWVVYRIIGHSEFVTSDNPVMFMDRQSFDVTPFHNGISNDNTVTFFPISPKLMIATYSYSTYLGLFSAYNEKLLFIDGKKDIRFINTLNRKQMEQCSRQVFGYTKETLEMLLKHK